MINKNTNLITNIYYRAQNICERYPDYRFNIIGIGELPPGTDENLGKCSQMACFIRLDILENRLNHTKESIEQPSEQQQNIIVPFPIEKFPYKLLFSKPFPFDQDARSVEEKIMDDVKYFINRHLSADDPYFKEDRDICEIPLANVLPFVHDVADLNELRTIVQKEFVINQEDCIEHKLIEESEYEESDFGNDDDDYNDNTDQQNAANHQNSNIDDDSWD